ncbi:MAG: DNA-binding response regulator [Marinilabiliales bacterium]|nr:MAG: DNA-binding response regulator [Marinilabiliales bacterium]
MDKIRLIIADDHQIVRDGIKSLLENEKEIEIIAEASNGNEVIQLVNDQNPDIVLLDISMPGLSGLEVAEVLQTEHPECKTLFLSMYINEEYILGAIKSGAKGYLPKNTTKSELLDAIHAIIKGKEYFSEDVSAIMLKSYMKRVKEDDEREKQNVQLTKRESEILKLFAEGLTNKEIADQLYISIRTVESHKNHIMQKLEFKSTVELVKYAIKNRLIDL